MEAEILSAVDNPTIMVAKLIASLVEQQRAAKRISNEQVGVIMTKLSDLIDAYSSSLAIAIAPAPVALSAFASFFTFVWVFTVCPIIALLEVDKATPTPAAFVLTIASTFFTALFFFGLFEAGNVVEAPLKTVLALTAVDNMCFSLSDDLSSLVDDPDQRVPVFMPRPAR